jgi:hypothetical protein
MFAFFDCILHTKYLMSFVFPGNIVVHYLINQYNRLNLNQTKG